MIEYQQDNLTFHQSIKMHTFHLYISSFFHVTTYEDIVNWYHKTYQTVHQRKHVTYHLRRKTHHPFQLILIALISFLLSICAWMFPPWWTPNFLSSFSFTLWWNIIVLPIMSTNTGVWCSSNHFTRPFAYMFIISIT